MVGFPKVEAKKW